MGIESIMGVMGRINEIQEKMRSFKPEGLKGLEFNRVLELKTKSFGQGKVEGIEGEGKEVEDVRGGDVRVEDMSRKDMSRKDMSRKDMSRKDMSGKDMSGKDMRGEILGVIREASREYGVSEDLIWSVIKAESNFDPLAVSRAGAKGLMQLMPGTAKELGVRDIFDIRENIFGGVKYLKGLLDRFEGDIELSLASYNAGMNRVMRAGGIPEIRETKEYVERVIRSYERMRGSGGEVKGEGLRG